MPATVNILYEPLFPVSWSPVAEHHADGPSARVGLLDLLLRSHEIEGLAVPDAPAHSALLRILYALTARVTGLDEALEGPDDWQLLRDEVLADGCLPWKGIERYFARHRERFFLFDPEPGGRPWMQDPRLSDQCDPTSTAGVNKLVVTRPSGNNHSWFRHVRDASPDASTASEAVLNLLTWHYYGPSGRCSSRTVNGVTTASAKAGPLRTSLSYHPEGDTLFETLLAGLVPPTRDVAAERDLCPWEWDDLPDPDGPPPVLTGPCSRLTAGSMHALLLVPEEDGEGVRDAYITWAYRTGRQTRPDDDYLIWQISKQGNAYPRPADSGRALWRDLDALLLIDPPGVAQPRRPTVFEWAVEVSAELRVHALGFEQDGQAKDTQFVDAVTPPVLGFVEKRSARTQPAVGRLRALGERFGSRLDRALRRAWRTYVNDPKDSAHAWAQEGAGRYWPAAEREFWDRFGLLDRTGTALDGGLDATAARTAFLRLAVRAFDDVTASAARTQRGAKAVEEARIELFGDRRSKPVRPDAA
ncbi:type I-E CRISPR-associated protein Cse1/CasA [Streptomyces nodosus]|uniref:CRISPR-associated protein Cse1 n=1 Tax=Streptomyces nodosus TaxID=40318 RepID=A0A0B5D973_9ACTN|nr:type I-E CRISPR-associated protein Cse1/CasA [Streptomyces nodosus]AJE40083.1 CRISPR-associated protein Cse1 [Streptomyces nodosus]MBB4791082.1 CRISPR system Cascade subunit CasA [Streptomyces nodosus]QEV38661.1 type I-E CRISPR-associated protein Cse1/CasA [Streptomyces nodosus]